MQIVVPAVFEKNQGNRVFCTISYTHFKQSFMLDIVKLNNALTFFGQTGKLDSAFSADIFEHVKELLESKDVLKEGQEMFMRARPMHGHELPVAGVIYTITVDD